MSLAALFAVQACAGLVARPLWPQTARMAARFGASRAAALMLILRWLPAALGAFAAVCLCVPAYLRLEPLEGEEEVGILCLTLAGCAVLSYLIPMARAAWRVVRSEVRLHELIRDAEEQSGLYVIRQASPAMALAGLIHSRVVVSRDVVELLTADQMDAARRHERAHLESHDNWKRVLMEAAPIDFGGRHRRVAWARFTEWAADDQATGGDGWRSVALASALVSVARLASADCLPQASLLVPDGRELRARVERLLEPSTRVAERFPAAIVVTLAVVAASLAVIGAQQPAAAAVVHRLLEALVD